MKNTKLIIVSGMSGAGKSSTSQKLEKQYQYNQIKHFWMHEEIGNHPIREGEFNIGSVHSKEDMDKNVEMMYDKWRRLVSEIQKSDSVYIMEGCLYQNIIRYFFECNYPIDKITNFYDTINDIIKPLNPTIVFLYRSDIRESFARAFKVRGERWKKLILDPEGDGYFKEHPYVGEESIYQKWEEYQNIASQMFDRIKGYKIKFDTLGEDWNQYMKVLTDYLGLNYDEEKKETFIEPARYCGQYEIDLDGKTGRLIIKLVEGKLYCQVGWWSNMEMIPLGNDEFELLGFPIKFSFKLGENQSLSVSGIYDWDINDKELVKVF